MSIDNYQLFMTEQDFVEKFVADLVSVYGYPKETIKRNVQIDIHRYDVLIQKGTVYIQAFEFKKKPIQGIRFIYQRFSEVSVDTPFYRVIFKIYPQFFRGCLNFL